MSVCGYIVTAVMIVISGLQSMGSSVENKTCLQVNVSNQRICYFQPKANLWHNWETAWNICQLNNATLPIVESQEIQMIFEQYLRNIRLSDYDIWLGGRQVTKKEWQWSNKKPFRRPDLISYGERDRRNQAVISRSSSAGVLPPNATIRYTATNSYSPCHYICQYPASRCPAENSIPSEHHGCLKVFNNQSERNAREATRKCYNSGGFLAIFDGDEFLTKTPKVYQQMRHQSGYCVGLQRIDTAEWFWMKSNNENSTIDGKNYSNWRFRDHEANDDCLFALSYSHRWAARRCDVQNHFICQTTEIQATEKPTTHELSETNTSGNLALIVGLSIGISSLAIISILIVIIANERRKLRTASVARRRRTEGDEEQYENLSRMATYENEANYYAELKVRSK